MPVAIVRDSAIPPHDDRAPLYIMRKLWGWSAPLALLTSGAFLLVDSAFFVANLLKVAEGGWIPLP